MKSTGHWFLRLLATSHLYAGLFVSPFVLLYALTAIMFNHQLGTDPDDYVVTGSRDGIHISVDQSLENLPLARSITSQLGLHGEIDFIRRNDKSIDIPLSRPGELDNIHVDLATSTASIESRKTTFAGTLLYLHSRPGPHLAGFRGNWFWIKVWRALADFSIYVLIVLTISGPAVWLALKQNRRAGLAVTVSSLAALLIVLLVMAG